ncbi:hypothetical protein KFL_000110080 [Klebsormidium nitens]|uniref:RING-type domain-containing protein n=1 Tax=Klebsormidium nitens TaxID=105231 RepID=A0A1Y1HL02_KLENI|nr:hypothetical protein KFL_000110080 [Klebsormidium nitens]|eukprot:GAQ78312.1 hypothetical protein KFL_000110080 [Klebsormidium nitens]
MDNHETALPTCNAAVASECDTCQSPEGFKGFETPPLSAAALSQPLEALRFHPFATRTSALTASKAAGAESSSEVSTAESLEQASTHSLLQTSSVHGLKRLRSITFFGNVENEATEQSPTKRFSPQGLEVQGLEGLEPQGLEVSERPYFDGLEIQVPAGLASHALQVEVGSPGSWATETGFEGLEAFDNGLETASPRSLGGFEGFGNGIETLPGVVSGAGFDLYSPATEVAPESSALGSDFDLVGAEGFDVSPEVLFARANHADLAGTQRKLFRESGPCRECASGAEVLEVIVVLREMGVLSDGGTPAAEPLAGSLDDLASGDFVSALGNELSECSESAESVDLERGLGFQDGGLGSGLEELEQVTGGQEEQARRMERIEALLAQEVVREAELIEARIALEGVAGMTSVPQRVDIATWLQGLRRGHVSRAGVAAAESGVRENGLGVGLVEDGLAEEADFSEVGSSIGNTSMAVFRGDLNSHLGSVLGEDDEGLEGLEGRVAGGLDGETMGPIPENVGGGDLVGFELAPTGGVEERGGREWVWDGSDRVRHGLNEVRVGLDGVTRRRRTREEEELPLLAHLSPRSEGGVSAALDSYPQLYYMDQLEDGAASEQIDHILTGNWNPRQALRMLADTQMDDVADDVAEVNLTELEWTAFLREALLGAWRREGANGGLEQGLGGVAGGLEEGLGAEQVGLEADLGRRTPGGLQEGLERGLGLPNDETLRQFSLLNPAEMVAALADPRLVARLETRAERGLFIQGTRVPLLERTFLGGLENDDVILSESDTESEAEESEVALDDVSEVGCDVIDDLDSYGAFCTAGGALTGPDGPPTETNLESGGRSSAQTDPPQDCSICYRPLEAEPVLALKCGHEYHGTCVKKWLKSGAPNALSCPFCRGKIRRTPALEELLPANGAAARLPRSPSEATIDLHDDRNLDADELLHEVRQWPDAERLIVSGIGVETVLQVLEEAQAEIRIIELYGTGEDRVAEEERFWYRMRGDALPPLPSDPTLSTARGCAAVQRLLLHNGEMRSGSMANPLGSPVNPGEATFTAFVQRVFGQLPNLVDFSAPACGPDLRPAGLAWLVECCPKLRILRLGWCSFPDLGVGIGPVAEALGRQLEELEILGPFLNLDSLNALVLHCRRLRVLNISRGHHGGRNWQPGIDLGETVDAEHTEEYDEAFGRLAQLNPLLRIEVAQGSQEYLSF